MERPALVRYRGDPEPYETRMLVASDGGWKTWVIPGGVTCRDIEAQDQRLKQRYMEVLVGDIVAEVQNEPGYQGKDEISGYVESQTREVSAPTRSIPNTHLRKTSTRASRRLSRSSATCSSSLS